MTPARTLVVLAGAAALLGMAGCRHDMYDQARYKPLRPSAFFPDGRSARPLPPGTVSREHLDADPALYQGMVDGQLVPQIPVPLTRALLQRGQERFTIFCTPCHARLGDGNGMIVQRGYTHPPSFHSERLRQAPAGHFFDVITNGWGAMPDYRAQVPVADRWAIVAYIRALQLSQAAPLSAVPAAHRGDLDQAQKPSPVPGRRGMYQPRVPLSAGQGGG